MRIITFLTRIVSGIGIMLVLLLTLAIRLFSATVRIIAGMARRIR